MPSKGTALTALASRPLSAMTSRFPRLGRIARAVRALGAAQPMPNIDWIVAPIALRRSPVEQGRPNVMILSSSSTS